MSMEGKAWDLVASSQPSTLRIDLGSLIVLHDDGTAISWCLSTEFQINVPQFVMMLVKPDQGGRYVAEPIDTTLLHVRSRLRQAQRRHIQG